ncbi:MAG TPA: deoxyribodipyrimidine photolyase [Candidatus Marinimicrobia bacterium]|nr:deoxyribodipyrimidine photolyase [Candidatus Neomarinimicrobiota bacterium]
MINDFERRRIRTLKKMPLGAGAVVYWMSRDQRAEDNWTLLASRILAEKEHRPLQLIFTLNLKYPGASADHFRFMLEGLKETEAKLRAKSIPLILLETEEPAEAILRFHQKNPIAALFTDFDPLRHKRSWKEQLISKAPFPVWEVDAHNIIPAWILSEKQEWAAYTIRPKVHRLLPDFLTDFPELKKMPLENLKAFPKINWPRISGVSIQKFAKSGSSAAEEKLYSFFSNGLADYSEKRNDPNAIAVSGLSPYLHFGQISAQRIAWEIDNLEGNSSGREAFLEELIVRRELAENYVFYQANYDCFEGIAPWAQASLNQHRSDVREFLYDYEAFENAKTRDSLWNAAQIEMKRTGKMHGYMRMYWAKKILEWTPNPETAWEYAIRLNDTWSLDGRDPNGYTGIAWSLGGVHDRAWFDRPVFGKIRYMNENGARKRFDVPSYIQKIKTMENFNVE